MKYPLVFKHDFFRGDYYEEMTPEEYEESIERFRNRMTELEAEQPTGASDRAYLGYLKTWFGNGSCDGWESYEVRYRFHKLPMSQTNYWSG